MFRILLALVTPFVFGAFAFGQTPLANPYEWLGQAHNQALEGVERSGYWQNNALPLDALFTETEKAAAQNQPFFGQFASNVSLAETAALLNDDFETKRWEYYNALRLTNAQKEYLEAVYLLPEDDAPAAETLAELMRIEQQLLSDQRLSAVEKALPAGSLAIAKHSLQYWAAFRFGGGTDSTKKDSTLSPEDLRKIKVPFKKWFKADMFGLMKGFIGGALVYGGSVYLKSPEAAGLGAGIWVLLTLPAIESSLYVRKYRRNELENENPYKEWEIDPNKL